MQVSPGSGGDRAADERDDDGLAGRLGFAQHLVGDRGRRWLRHQHDDLHLGVAAQQIDGLAERDRADLLGQVAAARADAVRDAAAELVDARRDLLQPGSRGCHHPNRPAPDLVREAQPDPADDGRPAVGTHHEQALLRRLALQLDLFLDGDVVAEEEDVFVQGKRLARDARPAYRPATEISTKRASGSI